MNIYKNTNVISGFLWRLMERMGAQAVSFVVSITLARILSICGQWSGKRIDSEEKCR